MGKHAAKTVLITGAARRIGRALAIALGKEGLNVAVHCAESDNEAQDLVRTLKTTGADAAVIRQDLRAPGSAEKVMTRAVDALGPIDYLVNNAASWTPSSIMSFDYTALMGSVTLNAYSPLSLIRSFSRHTKTGAVLNLLDCRITDYDRANAAYHLSKRMLNDITRTAAIALAPRVRVNAVAPGLILPPAGGDDNYLFKRRKSNLLERVGTPNDITDAALFLLKAESVTGQVIFVDGGRNVKGSTY